MDVCDQHAGKVPAREALHTPGLQGSLCSAFSSASGPRPARAELHVFSEARSSRLNSRQLGSGCCLRGQS